MCPENAGQSTSPWAAETTATASLPEVRVRTVAAASAAAQASLICLVRNRLQSKARRWTLKREFFNANRTRREPTISALSSAQSRGLWEDFSNVCEQRKLLRI